MKKAILFILLFVFISSQFVFSQDTEEENQEQHQLLTDKFHFDVMGYNGKMSNVLAAIGCAVISEADEVIEKRKKNVEYFNNKFRKNWYATSPHCYPMSCEDRNKQLIKLEENEIETRKLFSCLPKQEEVYKKLGYNNRNILVSENIGKTGYFLPIHQDLTEEDLVYIASKI